MSLHDLTVQTIDHKLQPLADYKGQVLLVVNTASECGATPQYAGLEQLWRAYRDRGFAVLGFPSNDFGAQEPGTEEQIQRFCSAKYDVTFPMFAKVGTRGAGQSPVYAFLSARHGEPKWNFHKYLVGKNGEVIRAFATPVQPSDAELKSAIESALAASG